MAPTLRHCVWSLPPEGDLAAWGGPAPLDMAPTLRHCVWSLPPEGALAAWGGPAPLDMAPTLPHCVGSLYSVVRAMPRMAR